MNAKSSTGRTDVENMQKSLLTGCNVCGRNHNTESCSFLRELKPVQDTKTPSRARLTLPTNLEVQNLADNTTTVVARAPFVRSIQFGPFIAKRTQMLHPAVNFPLKIFGKTEESSYFLDTSDEESCNWMCLVAPATNCKEQNLICYQMGQDIYYTVMKDIQPGEQLRVWYAPYYAVKMGAVPFNMEFTASANRGKVTDHVYESKQKLKEKERKNFHGMLLSREVTQKLAEQLPAKQLGARKVPDRWRCRVCSAEETSVVSFAKHLMSHYKRSLANTDRLLECHICQQKFATEKLLVKHKVVRHKMVIQRPRLLENMEEEESAVIDENPEDEMNDTPEGNEESGMTSIVIANLTGELPSQFTQPGAQTIFVTNAGQIFSDPVPENELQDRQNDALNALLEQLQSSDAYADSTTNCDVSDVVDNASNSETAHNIGSDKVMQENVFSHSSLSGENGNLITDSNTSNQFGTIEEEEEEEEVQQQEEAEESESMSILSEYKTDTPVPLNAQQNNGENIINIINAHVTLLEDSEDQNSIIGNDKSKCSNIDEVVEPVTLDPQSNKSSEIHNSIFETFEARSAVTKDLLTQSEINNSLADQYQVNETTKSKDNIQVNLINTTNGISSNVNCIINPEDMETDETTTELQLTVEQDDMSSAFLELVSVPNFDTSNNTNPNKESVTADDGQSSLQDDIHLLRGFDLDSVPEEPILLQDDTVKTMNVGPPYNCDICNKEFHKADYLYRHLRKHTGEFTCVSCLAVFARKESLVNHLCLADSSAVAENASFICPYCQKKFLLKKLFKRHMAKHTGEWKCDKCQRRYSSKTTLASHRCTKKPNPTYKCQICKKEFLRYSYLDKHMLLHVENHPCSTCGKKLPSGKILDNHQLYCSRGKLLETVGETTCPHCSVVFSQLVPYRQHVHQHTHPFMCQTCGARFRTDSARTVHTCSEYVFRCEVCNKEFAFFNLSRHQVIHDIPQFHCYECGKSFLRSENFSNHSCSLREESKETRKRKKKTSEHGNEERENLSSEGNGGDESGVADILQMEKGSDSDSKTNGLVCDVCGEIYKTIHILKAHMQLHGERKYVCEICNKRFHRKDVLQEHHSVHQEAQIPCPLCNKKLKTKKSLDVHMHRHTGIKRYSCSVCGKKFFQKGNLLKHAVVHNPNAKMILTCDHCNKNFTSRDYLAQHILEHTQGRIHQCHLCDKGFVKEHMLKGHIKKFHGGRLYVCPYCNMSVRHRTSIRRHLENRHGELQHEWTTPGFLDKLESGTNDDTLNSLPNTSLQSSHRSSESDVILTAPQNSQQIVANSDLSLTETTSQAEGTEILLTVSGMPIAGSGNEVQSHVDQAVIGDQMELQVETEIQGDEVAVGNTFIFSDGTIVQQEDGTGGGEIFLYVLDPGEVSIEPGFT